MKIIKPNKDFFLSFGALFVFYLLFSSLAVLGFRYFFPGQAPPLPSLARSWNLIQGIFALLSLLPALIMSALVFPFGLYPQNESEVTRFSPRFFQLIKGPIVAAICASLVYGLLFFIVQPGVQNFRADLKSQGIFFRLAQGRAQEHAGRGEWPQAAIFIGLCERIWPESPGIEELRREADVHLAEIEGREQMELAEALVERDYWDTVPSGIPDQRKPLGAADALSMAETALREERFYDAHWLATLAERLAGPGSPELGEAPRIAALAWTGMASLAPNARDRELYSLYRLKQSGYEAMLAGDWIRAYYIFLELRKLSPGDPDVINFLAQSEREARKTAFFTDEIDTRVGEILTEAVFSLPANSPRGGGRGVMRFATLSVFADYAYGFGVEFISLDGEDRILSHFTAPYAKILPITLNSQGQTLMLMRVLDRYDRDKRWEPAWIVPAAGDSQIILEIDYETFRLLAQVRQGLDDLSLGQIFNAAKSLETYGYIPQVFQSELIYRLSEPLFLLPMAIVAIILGWRFRARKPPRYAVIPMLFVLPLVFNGLVYAYRYILNVLGIWTVLSLGFSSALLIYTVGAGILFVLSLIMLASQRG
ncbi:MAG: hypothetical protein LBT87_05145 [Treponema sp.]|jgi:hypothetical protein|nr:hypothetical protein [Treponema sp.]